MVSHNAYSAALAPLTVAVKWTLCRIDRIGHNLGLCIAWLSIFLVAGGGTAAMVQVTGLYGGLWLDAAFSGAHGTAVIPLTGVMMCVFWPMLGLITRILQKGVNSHGFALSWDDACIASWLGFMICTWPIGIVLVNKTAATGLFFLGFFFIYWWRKPKKEPLA